MKSKVGGFKEQEYVVALLYVINALLLSLLKLTATFSQA